MFDAEGQIRTMSSLLDELAPKWNTLTTNQQTYLATQVAGKHRISQFLALMNNYDEKISATASAYDSLGSASEENERYMGSMEAKLNAISSSFEQLSSNMLDSGVLKFFMEFGKFALDATDFLGGWNVAMLASLAMLKKWNKGIPQKVLTSFSEKINEAGIVMSRYSGKTAIGTKAVQGLGTAVTGLNGVLATLLPVLAIMATTELFKWFDETSVSVEEAKQKVTDLTDELTNLQSEYDELANSDSLTESESQKLSILEKQIALQKESIELAKQSAFSAEFEGDVGWFDQAKSTLGFFGNLIKETFGNRDYADAWNQFGKEVGEGVSVVNDIISETQKLTEENKKLADSVNDGSKSIKDINDEFSNNATQINENKQELIDYYTTLKEQRESIGNTDNQQEYYDNLLSSMEQVINSESQLIDSNGNIVSSNEAVADSTTEVEDAQSSLTTVMESLASETELLTTAWKEQSSDGELSVDTVMKMIEAGSDYINLLEVENGTYKLNAQGALDLFETKKQVAIQDIQLKREEVQAQISAMEATLSAQSAITESTKGNVSASASLVQFMGTVAQQTITALGETSSATVSATSKAMKQAQAILKKSGTTGLTNSLNEAKAKLAQYDKSLEVLNNLTLPTYAKTTTSAKQASDSLSAATDALQQNVDALKDSLEDAKDALSNMETAYKAMQSAIVSQLEKEIALQEDKLDLIEKQKQIYEAQQEQATSIIDKEIQAIQDKIDALDEEKEKEDAILKLQEAQLVAEKAKDAYEQAKSDKNTRVYSAESGWTWEADPSAIEDAKQEMEDALKDLDDIQKEQELDQKKYDFQQQIDELEKLKDSWGQNMEDIFDDIKNHEDVLEFAKKFESATLEERKAMLEEFTKKYGEDIVEQNKSTNDSIDKLKELKEQWQDSMDISEDISKYAGAQDWLKKFENASYEERKAMLASFTNSWKNYYAQQEASIDSLQAKLDSEQAKLDAVKKSADNAGSGVSGLSGQNYGLASATAHSNAVLSEQEERLKKLSEQFRNVANGMIGLAGNAITNAVSKATGKKYATGGVDDFGTNGIVNYTGDMITPTGSVQVDGGAVPEVILNSKQQANILFQLANNPSRVKSGETTNNNNSPIIVQNLNIKASDNDTLDRLLTQAQQMVRNR